MSQGTNSVISSIANGSEESLQLPIISKADTLPEIDSDEAKELSNLHVSDGDFHTKAVVNSKFLPSRTRTSLTYQPTDVSILISISAQVTLQNKC